ncbi:pentatricopeptide repeat-containing protein At4g38150 [Punica granatum]|uniref:Pentatricopeptide repeat-containing protein At4g38150 n=2 Tax=Punica granatum TaxID=22663 RepID=A0A6P8CCK9_PUNGR|nr:pentatricopeptide repeat-containing protein At4g38150 [Punica granatum]XP_031380727.1 pentatricopeptide repeat-containing protein At4g38150 [Punica granatum]XP_031380728.1 pentatricopeptide repeat-containing protein At4g38150 [Punica granatum]XP_031380730.1 pentatricopeptide repeat-containing protein At4g38150 [Punica granatum]
MAGARDRLLFRSFCLSRLSLSHGGWKASVLRYFSSNADGFGFNTGDEGSRKTRGQISRDEDHSAPPDPLPNRPLRGQQQPDWERPVRNNRSNMRRDRMRNDVSDDNFLEKFKLSFDKVDKPRRDAPTAQPLQEENKSNQDQTVNEQRPPTPEDADEIFKKMKETGLIPNAVAMLDGLCKDGLIQEAMKLFGLMRERGTIPEVVIYTAVVEGFCKAHKFDDAKRIFRKMQANGITPNVFSYTILVQGLYKCNRVEDALEFCEEMVEAGHSPNVMTFVGLVDGLCKEKGVEEARGVIERLRQKGFFINEKAVREFLDKKAPFSPVLWEVIFGKKPSQQLF